MAVFGQLIQGNMGIEEFSAKIKKVCKIARMAPEQQREQFIRGLNPMNQYNIRMMAKFNDTQDNITEALAEAEKFTLSQKSVPSSFPIFPTANPYADTNKSKMTKTEIVDLIKTAMASSESQTAQQNANLRSTIKSFQETMSRATKTLDNSKKSSKKRAEDIGINHFLSDLLRKNPDVLLRNHQVTNAPSAEDLDIIPETALERKRKAGSLKRVKLILLL
ncbi:hypothetical protein C2G38_677480 [Gigaspora rosea]|uniref:Uncharacterized protein n=1 Tax=Gigaspora rosea TaxID=44941 RepID=A0A397U2Q1_9GLOM|nr:hypothetical protein C2G38_677480 [Gigaspora rosea]